MISAAGGVLWRADGTVAVVRRDRYDDWTLPKGGVHSHESELLAAVREVGEEAGAQVAVSRRLDTIEYRLDGRRKTVSFWAMRHLSGEFIASPEIDDLAWVASGDAASVLTYAGDRRVVAGFYDRPFTEAVVILVRHARAGKRGDWAGDDRLRPLDSSGIRQADRLGEFLCAFAPHRVLAADRTRCVQTVAPLAAKIGVEVETSPEFSDEGVEADERVALRSLRALAKPGTVAVVCSQGTAIPSLLERLDEVGGIPPKDPTTRKGAAWVLCYADGDVISADYYAAAARST